MQNTNSVKVIHSFNEIKEAKPIFKPNIEKNNENDVYYVYIIGTGVGTSAKHSMAIEKMEQDRWDKNSLLGITKEFIDKNYKNFIGKTVDIDHDNSKIIGKVVDYFYNDKGFVDSENNTYDVYPWIGQPIFLLEIDAKKFPVSMLKEYNSSSMEFEELVSTTKIINGIPCSVPEKILPISLTLTKCGINTLSNGSVVKHSYICMDKTEKEEIKQSEETTDNVKQQDNFQEKVLDILSNLIEKISRLEKLEINEEEKKQTEETTDNVKQQDLIKKGEQEYSRDELEKIIKEYNDFVKEKQLQQVNNVKQSAERIKKENENLKNEISRIKQSINEKQTNYVRQSNSSMEYNEADYEGKTEQRKAISGFQLLELKNNK